MDHWQKSAQAQDQAKKSIWKAQKACNTGKSQDTKGERSCKLEALFSKAFFFFFLQSLLIKMPNKKSEKRGLSVIQKQ